MNQMNSGQINLTNSPKGFPRGVQISMSIRADSLLLDLSLKDLNMEYFKIVTKENQDR